MLNGYIKAVYSLVFRHGKALHCTQVYPPFTTKLLREVLNKQSISEVNIPKSQHEKTIKWNILDMNRFLADPGEASGCSTNTFVTHSVPRALRRHYVQTVRDSSSIVIKKLSKSWSVSKSHQGLKSYGHFSEAVDFAYWWSWIGKGLRLQPAQQACFLSAFSLVAIIQKQLVLTAWDLKCWWTLFKLKIRFGLLRVGTNFELRWLKQQIAWTTQLKCDMLCI